MTATTVTAEHDEETAGHRDPGDRRLVRAVALLCAAAFVVFVASPVRYNHDSYLNVPTAYALVHERTFDLRSLDAPPVQQHYGLVDGPDGARVNYFPWALTLWAVPAVVALDAAHALGVGPGAHEIANGGPMDLIGVVIASAIAAGVIALMAAITADRLRRDLPRRRLTVLLVAGGFAFGTGVWSVATRALWQHAPSMLALAAALWCLQRLTAGPPGPLRSSTRADAGPPGPLRSSTRAAVGPPGRRAGRLAMLAGAALAAGYTFRPTNATVIVVLTVYVALRHRDLLIRYGCGALAVAVPWVVVNVAAFGAVLPPYYAAQRVGLHDAFVEALAANLVSPNRGLLVFTPVAVLAAFGLWSKMRKPMRPGMLTLDRAIAVAAVLQLLAASAYGERWWAGNSYGPRFLTDALVLLTVLAVPAVATLADPALRAATIRRPRLMAGAAVLALVWSVLAASQGAVFRATTCWHGRVGLDEHPEQVWSVHPPQALAGVDRLVTTGSVRKAVLDDCGP